MIKKTVSIWYYLVVSLALTAPLSDCVFGQSIIHVPGDQPTIQGGIDASNSGDTVLVSPGIYPENIDFKGKGITLTSGATGVTAATGTVITGSGNGPIVIFHMNETRSSILNGFTIRNGTSTAVYLSGASPTLSNNVVANNTGCAVVVAGSTASPSIVGNKISQTVQGTVDCKAPGPVYFANPGVGLSVLGGGDVQVIGNTIESNISSSCGGAIAAFNTSSLLLTNNVIRNNTAACAPALFERGVVRLSMVQNLIYNNTRVMKSQVGGAGAGVTFINDSSPQLPATLTFVNNTLSGNSDPRQPDDPGSQLIVSSRIGIAFDLVTIENNLFISDVDGSAVQCGFALAPTTLVLAHNDIFNVGPAVHPTGCIPNDLAAGNLMVDPLFINAAGDDFHTQRTSPIIGAGDYGAPQIPPADLDAKAREVCGTIDMGVYEIRPRPVPTLASSNNPAVGGTSVTFTGSVPGNCNIPTGTLTFLNDGKPIGTATLDTSASANVSTATLTVGTHTITANYPGDFNFETGTSNTLVQVVTGYPSTTSLSISPNRANALAPVTFSSTVSSSFGVPTGTVAFTSGGTTLATGTLDAAGHASATATNLSAGTYNVVAIYSADTNVAASSSSPVLLTVLGDDTVTTLTASPNPASLAQTVAFAVSLRAAQGSVLPTGTVTFSDGAAALGTVTVAASGTASFSSSSLSLGTHTITARYNGSGNFNPSGASVSETITLVSTALTLAASPNPSNTGQAVTITAIGTSSTGMAPAGLVTFRDGALVLGTAALDAHGSASFITSALAVGTHPLQATLSAGSTFAGSSSPLISQVVLAYDFSLSTSKTTISLPSGDWTVLTLTVTPVGGFHGSVQLGCGNLPLYAECVVAGGNTVSLADGPRNVQLTLDTSTVYRYGNQVGRLAAPYDKAGPHSKTFAVLLFPAFTFLSLFRGRRALIPTLQRSVLALGVLAVLLGIQACSGKYPDHTAPGVYAVTVSGSDTSAGSSLQHTAALQITVTK